MKQRRTNYAGCLRRRRMKLQSYLVTVLVLFLLTLPTHAWTTRRKKEKQQRRPIPKKSDWVERMRAVVLEDETENDLQEHQQQYMDGILQQWMDRVFSTIFVTKPPRGIYKGFISAVQNLVRGYQKAILVAVSYAWDGWDNSGFVGLFTDSIVGTCSGALIAASGMVASLHQVVYGIVGTATAFRASSEGMVWDEDSATWDYFSLEDEALQLERLFAFSGKQDTMPHRHGQAPPQLRRRSQNRVKDLSYYTMLKVPADATPSEIKRAYYREALNVHPDKKQHDAEAAAKFHQLSSVYQTLMNEEMREAYDTLGATCFEQGHFHEQQDATATTIDPYIFFAVMFGSYLVEPYVGQLALASTVNNLFLKENAGKKKLGQKDSSNDPTLQQRKRQVDIALNLRDRVVDYVSGKQSTDAFRASCRIEAEAISKGDFGNVFLVVIGSAMVSESNQFLGYQTSMWGLKGQFVQVQNMVGDIMRSVSTKSALVRTFKSVKKAYGQVEKEKEWNESQRNDKCFDPQVDAYVSAILDPQTLSDLLDLGWKFNTQDITTTVREACRKLFDDGNDMDKRMKRGEAVGVLGKELFSVGTTRAEDTANKNHHATENIQERAEGALLASIVPNDGWDDAAL